MAWFSFHCECQNKVRLGIYFIEKTKKSGSKETAENLFYWNYYSIEKVDIRSLIYFIEKVKIRYDLGLIHWKGQNNARPEICFIEHEKIRYGCGFISVKILKYFTAEDFWHSKYWNKVLIYSNEKSQNKVQLGIYSIEKTEIRKDWGKPRPHLFPIRESAWKTILII